MNCENCGGRGGKKVKNWKEKYGGTPLYGHPLNTDSRILWTVSFVPTKSLPIF